MTTNSSFPTLYSRTSTGAVQTWLIIVDGSSYYTRSGQVGGVITQSERTWVEGKNLGKKNETSANEQAQKDAQSKFDKQKKSGGYHESVNDIDSESFVSPMLAKSFKDRKGKAKFPALVQCKFNGGRMVATRHGLFSRKGERYMTCPHIENSLKPFFLEFPDAVLDGEAFNNELRQQLSEIMKLIRRSVHITAEHLKESREKVSFWVYDGYRNEADKKSPYKTRKLWIDEVVNKYEFLSFVKTDRVENEDEMWIKYNEYISDLHEGAMYRAEDSEYENKRSANLLKLKPVDDQEFLVVDIMDGNGAWAGLAKVVTLQMDDGRRFNATFKGNMIQAADCLKNKDKYIGNKYTCYFNGYTSYMIPNYCMFDINNSVLESDK